MSSPFNTLSGNILKSLSFSNKADFKGSSLVKAVVEKKLSLFEYSFKTDSGNISLFSDKTFSKGDLIKIQASLLKNGQLILSDEKGIPLKFSPSPEFLNSFKADYGIKINIKGSMEKVLSLPKFLVSTEFGNLEVESELFLKNGDILKLDLNEVKNFISSRNAQNLENIKTDFLSKLPSREILKILDKNPEKIIKNFLNSVLKIDSKESLKVIDKIIDNFLNPLNSSGNEIKSSLSYFLGSSFDDFQEDLNNFKGNLLKFQSEKPGLNPEELKDIFEKTDKFLESIQDQKNLNSLRFSDSSKMYFFLPFQGKDSSFGEFLIEQGKKNKKGNNELRALLKLELSNLGLLMADLRLSGKNLKIYFGVESGLSKNIIESGFELFKTNLKKAGFNEISIYCTVVEKQKIKESLIKDFLKTDNENSRLSIIA
ncbi:MAG: flagellar hook-length control protein FliK [Desulforegulaceae bacterium]|nr:flagellar hook-length control protein FliK [Desulforegulaceae bacterium]